MALLAQFLVAFGTACGRGAHYLVEADRHYPNEFCILVGPSAKKQVAETFGLMPTFPSSINLARSKCRDCCVTAGAAVVASTPS